tara:strand:- start:371 stop:757 length:387 start_codon:yes stop_codon:yes gene_type:complete
MNTKYRKIRFLIEGIKNLKFSIVIISIIFIISLFPNQSWASQKRSGEELFLKHCAGCHLNGGNIIRRRKTLKLSALRNNGLDNPKEIAKIARLGTGIMDGYEEVLGEDGDQIVANWIWEKAQNAWVQG